MNALSVARNDGALGDAMDASLAADLAFGKALCGLQSLNVKLRHLASWRMRHPYDKGTVVAIRRTLEGARDLQTEARMAFLATSNATSLLVRELAQTAGVCEVCLSPALHGVCDDCNDVLSEPSF